MTVAVQELPHKFNPMKTGIEQPDQINRTVPVASEQLSVLFTGGDTAFEKQDLCVVFHLLYQCLGLFFDRSLEFVKFRHDIRVLVG